ncbi:MAG: bifunctional lysylphosphatidylglycerol flippase/synthetase MprF [Candidatus Cloacimonas sp.]
MAKKKYTNLLSLFISLGFLIFAYWIIHNKLQAYSYHQIIQSLHSIPQSKIFLAFVFTCFSYLVMTLYDYLALKYVNFKLSYPKITLSSFISYSFSNSLGHPLITGTVRYRIYSGWGLNAVDIIKVIVFCSYTIWLGFILLIGSLFTFTTVTLPVNFPFTIVSKRILGILLLSLILIYIVSSASGKINIKFKKGSITFPPLNIVFPQLLVSVIDWLLAGSILYILLPAEINIGYFNFLGYYLVAMAIAIVSQVPGGIGVFESVMLIILGNFISPLKIMGVLLTYRVIYYLVPLGLGAVIFTGKELLLQRKQIKYALSMYDRIISPFAPQVYAILTFLAGIILLFSTVTPSVYGRVLLLYKFIPIPIIELSHFICSIIGIALLFVSRGLQKRINSAYWLTILMLIAGILVSLLKGFDYEEAIILTIMLLLLIPSKNHFYRKSSLINQPFTPSWIFSILMVIISAFWLGFFSYKHITYSNELWWTFSLHGDAPRFLRATVGVTSFLLILGIVQLLRHPAPTKEINQDMDAIRKLVKYSDDSNVNLAFLGDKLFFFNQAKTAFIMYAIEGRCWIAMGEPVGFPEAVSELAWQFREYCDKNGGIPVFYQIRPQTLNLFLDMGLIPFKIGERAKVDLKSFNLSDPEFKRQRRTIRKVEETGCSTEILLPEQIPDILPKLREISDSWLKLKHKKEKGFSLGFFSEEYISEFPIILVKKENEIVAFANIWTTENKEMFSVDLMRYNPDKVNGVMEYIFLKLMLWAKENQYQWFDLGNVTLSGLQDRSIAPLWHRVGSLIFRLGSSYYGLQGLRQFKEKFKPVWESVYVASPQGIVLPEILINITNLISKGYRHNLK